jgi:RimJ/RimL family protein N-acetyltransferase
MCLSLRPVAPDAFDLVRHIAVQPDQILFSGTVAQAFKTKEAGVDFHAILIKETALGFFKIDRSYGISKDNELGLRGFMIDQRHQGKGHATSALCALPDYLHQHYPDYTGLVLTVDIQNTAAIACYRKSGFLNSGKLYFGGFLGPQQVMRLSLLAA